MAAHPRNVFINCAFDAEFEPLFHAIVFTVIRSGFRARCATESDDAGENRFSKIQQIVEECRYGIHDISRTETSGNPPLPRFNMPLELGLFLGARRFGDGDQKKKKTLILDREQYRFQRFVSDLAGQDIHSHNGDVSSAVREVATWLRTQSRSTTVPGGMKIADEFALFQEALPAILGQQGLLRAEMTFGDYTAIAVAYIKENA
ncbi:MAG: hypothetical protein EOS07_31915 [Mesorhizobium sp.]|nr:MAG: hypothetical protein EOS07_31915 [Mesorhizobium sp.]